jgi:acyl-CoA thioesterase FadM
MTKNFSSTYPIRFYECDASGQLNKANTVRLAIEATREMFAEHDGIENLDHWFLGELQSDYKATIEHADTLTIKTNVSGWRHDGLIVSQELRNGAGEVVAIVYADWDYIDPATLTSVSVPEEILKSFFPDGIHDTTEYESFAEDPDSPHGAFAAVRRARAHNMNSLGLVDQGWLVNVLEELHDDANNYGNVSARFPNDYGLNIARQHNIEWLEPVSEGSLKITTFISEVDEYSIARWYLFTRESDGELVARAQSLWEWIDGNTMERMLIPPEYLEDLEEQIAS